MSEFAPKSGSNQAPTETESLLAGKMAEHRLNQWTDTNSMDSMKDLQGYLEGRPMQGNYDEKITQTEKDPLDVGIFQNDVFYDRESDTVFSIDSQREVGGEKVYSISTVNKNGSEAKEIMTEAEVRAYLQGKELVDEGSGRRLAEEGEFQGEFETKSAPEATKTEGEKTDEPSAPKRQKKDKSAAKQAKTAESTSETKAEDATDADDASKEKADEPKKQAVFTSKFGELSRDEQVRVIDAAYGKSNSGQNSSELLTPEQVAKHGDAVAESIVKAAKANGYKSPEAEQAPVETTTEPSAPTSENKTADDAENGDTEDTSKKADTPVAPTMNGQSAASNPGNPERQTTPQTSNRNLGGENVDFAEQPTRVLPVASRNGSAPHENGDIDLSELEAIRNASGAELDAENAADSGETEESVEASRWSRAKAAFRRGYDRIGAAYAMGQARAGEQMRPDEDDPNSKKRIWIAAGAAAGVLVAVGGVWLATRGIGNGGSGGNASAVSPEMVAPPANNGGDTGPEVIKNLLDGYSVPQGGHGEDVMAAAGRPSADWYGGLGSELANKLPNEFTQLAANDIRINRPGVLSEEAQKIIENWHR